MSRCVFCDSSVNRKKGVFCSGPCKNLYHIECANIPSEIISYLNSVAGLEWKCPECRSWDSRCETRKLMESFEKRCTEFMTEITSKFETLKDDLSTAVNNSVNPTQTTPQLIHQPTFAEVSKRMQKIVIKPKNSNQSSSATKSDLKQVLNPESLHVPISNVKHTRDGGIILGSNQLDGITYLKETVERELSSKYEVHQLKSAHHQVRIVGMTELYDNDTFKKFLIKQNSDIFPVNIHFNVVRLWPTKKNKSVFQALLQLDSEIFDRIISKNQILIGLDSCSVYEAFDIPRCFNCCSFFHTKKFCKNLTKCPICSGEHEVKNCTVKDNFQCVNCTNLKVGHKLDLNTNHAAWDLGKCFAYKKALEKFKSDLIGTPGK